MASYLFPCSLGLRVPEGGDSSHYPTTAWAPGALCETAPACVPEQAMRLRGDFTYLRSIIDLSTPALERALGMYAGRLRGGYEILALAAHEDLMPSDFELGSNTPWAGGHLMLDPHGRVVRLGEAAARSSQPSDPPRKLEDLKREILDYIDRDSEHTPAMVRPRVRHEIEVPLRYSIPQYTLVKDKVFVVVKTMR